MHLQPATYHFRWIQWIMSMIQRFISINVSTLKDSDTLNNFFTEENTSFSYAEKCMRSLSVYYQPVEWCI